MLTISQDFIALVKTLYPNRNEVHLHEPQVGDEEKHWLCQVIDSGFVSSVGPLISEFENQLQQLTGAEYVIATNSGSSALHVALLGCGVKHNDEVITQSLSFVATSNAIQYCHAHPVYLDIDDANLGLSASKLNDFLASHCEMRDDGYCWNTLSNRRVKACLPTHIFGFAANIVAIKEICERYNIHLVEDSAEALGSYLNRQHLGTFGDAGILSFNGNKIITTGGGGVILTNDETIAKTCRHLANTAKAPITNKFYHDELGFNYRMNNLNAALGLAQLQKLPGFLTQKRQLAKTYQDWVKAYTEIDLLTPDEGEEPNYWLSGMVFQQQEQAKIFLHETNKQKVFTRPVWTPLHELPHLQTSLVPEPLLITEDLASRIVNLPGGVVGLKSFDI